MPTARTIFDKIDAGDPRALKEHLAADATMVFGGGAPLLGPEAIVEASEALLASIRGVRHHIVNEWAVGPTTIAESEVTYTRLDGRDVTIPAASIWTVGSDGLIMSFRVYLDQAPVYAP